MVLGIGEGSIEIVLDEGQKFEPGQAIKGKLRLELKERKKASKIRIEFYGEVKKRERNIEGEYEDVLRKVHLRSKTLEGELEYPAGMSEYEFEIKLPDVKARERKGDILGKIIDFIMPDPLWKTKWFLDASLEIPMSFDINRKMQVDFRV